MVAVHAGRTLAQFGRPNALCWCLARSRVCSVVLQCVALCCVITGVVMWRAALRCVTLRFALRCVALRCVALRCVVLRCLYETCFYFRHLLNLFFCGIHSSITVLLRDLPFFSSCGVFNPLFLAVFIILSKTFSFVTCSKTVYFAAFYLQYCVFCRT